MQRLFSAFWTVLLLLWSFWLLLQLPAMALQMSRAGHSFERLLKRLEDSYCDSRVADECVRTAAAEGYRLTLRELSSYREGRLCRVEMIYTVRLWGGAASWEEVLTAYAG